MDDKTSHQGINFEWDADKALANFKNMVLIFKQPLSCFSIPF